jgi:hypothetical protein
MNKAIYVILGVFLLLCGCVANEETTQPPGNEMTDANAAGAGQDHRPRNMTEGFGRPDGNMTPPDFSKYDADGDGTLDEEERTTAQEVMSSDPAFMQRFDADGDGTLSEEEKKVIRQPRNGKQDENNENI